MQKPSTLRLHSFKLSGHSHRARLMLALLGVSAEIIEIDMQGGAHKRSDFLSLNPFGQVPVLEDGATVIADSNAILVYLCTKHDAEGCWLPRDPLGMAGVQRWLSVAAGPLAYGPAAARAATLFNAPLDKARAQQIATGLLGVMENELTARAFLTGDRATVADVALYSYIAHAPEGGILLEPYPAVQAWLGRVEGLPGFIAMARVAPTA